MANTNVKGTPTALLDTRLWAGSPTDSTAWLQSPIGSNAAVGTMSMAVIELVADDGDAATVYDLTLTSNPVTGTELIAVMSIISSAEEDGTAGAASAIPVAGNLSSPTAIKFTGAGANGKDTTYRIAFLYR
tara:strand:+ start:14197 stop:14589 length:393 start_codon:yes stop_codon:yes gene_type:complete